MNAEGFAENQFVILSAIAQYGYCLRRCALIHIDNLFEDNIFTLQGSLAHVRADEPTEMTSGGIVEERALPIWSECYGLYGKADVVEFHADGSIYPVEYKRGPKRKSIPDELQLCAQAICLEEMFNVKIPYGAIYSSSSQARREVEIADDLRTQTLNAARAVRALLATDELPPPVNDARCPNCSLVSICIPHGVSLLSNVKAERFLFSPVDMEVVE